MKFKHSKVKNTGILFELLVRQITSDTLSGKESKAVNILKKYFVKTELGKEYKLYENLSKYKNLTEGKAELVLNSIIDLSKGLNRGTIKRQKFNLVKEILTHYNSDDFFKTKLPNYKAYASLYTLIELYNSPNPNPTQIIENKINLLETITLKDINKQKVTDDVITEFQTYDKDVRILTYKILLDKFNEKYSTLSSQQKTVLKEFVESVDSTPKLKAFYNQKVEEIKKELTLLSNNITEKAIQIKLNEVIKFLVPLSKTSKIGDNEIINILQYYELLNEFKSING
jgi:hypothetical protein